MPFKKGNPGKPKGAVSKLTKGAKEAFALAAEGMGGAAGLTNWARANPTEFWKLYARLIPVEQHLSGAEGAPIGVVILPPVAK